MPSTVIVADVYAAGEAPIAGVTRDALVEGCARAATAASCRCPRPRGSPKWCFAIAKPGDFVVCLGAGTITQWAAALPGELTALQASARARRGPVAA